MYFFSACRGPKTTGKIELLLIQEIPFRHGNLQWSREQKWMPVDPLLDAHACILDDQNKSKQTIKISSLSVTPKENTSIIKSNYLFDKDKM